VRPPEPPLHTDADAPWAMRPPPPDAGLDSIYLGPAELSREHSDTRTPGADDVEQALTERPWGLQTAREFLARQFPPIRYLYLDLVPAESVTVLMAAPNAGKTFLALEIGARVAAAAAAAGQRVVICEEEGAGAALQLRLRRALAAVGADEALLDRIGIAWNSQRSLLVGVDLASLIVECKGADLVILDSLAALCEDVDENDSKAMGQVARALQLLKSEARCGVLALHHMTKEAWKEGEVPTLRHMRGHSKLPGRVDAVLALTPGECDRDAVRFDVHCLKMRDGGERPQPRRMTVSMLGPAATVEMEVLDRTTERRSTKETQMVSDVLSVVKKAGEQGASKRWVERNVTGNATAIRRTIDALHADGLIEKNEDDRYVLSGGASDAS